MYFCKGQEQAFFSRIVCAAAGGMTGSVKGSSNCLRQFLPVAETASQRAKAYEKFYFSKCINVPEKCKEVVPSSLFAQAFFSE